MLGAGCGGPIPKKSSGSALEADDARLDPPCGSCGAVKGSASWPEEPCTHSASCQTGKHVGDTCFRMRSPMHVFLRKWHSGCLVCLAFILT